MFNNCCIGYWAWVCFMGLWIPISDFAATYCRCCVFLLYSRDNASSNKGFVFWWVIPIEKKESPFGKWPHQTFFDCWRGILPFFRCSRVCICVFCQKCVISLRFHALSWCHCSLAWIHLFVYVELTIIIRWLILSVLCVDECGEAPKNGWCCPHWWQG